MPLNSQLYKELKKHFGTVVIADEGCGMLADYSTDLHGRCILRSDSPGEYYRINCPFCNDTIQRLWINHRWGVYDEKTKSHNYFLAICYNEHCLEDSGNLAALKQKTAWYGRSARAGQVKVSEGDVPTANKPIALPADFLRLDELSADHAACHYLLQRGFDPATMARKWGLGFSYEACRWSLRGRLVIPVYDASAQQSQLMGWQARAIADDDDPKYYTARGFKKSRVLYGMQRVAGTGPVVICEGPTDVWRLGAGAVALLGKTASSEQRRLIREHFEGRPLIIMLDADAHADAQKLQSQLVAARRQSLMRRDMAAVVIGELPAGHDPGDCRPAQLKKIIKRALSQTQQTAPGTDEQ